MKVKIGPLYRAHEFVGTISYRFVYRAQPVPPGTGPVLTVFSNLDWGCWKN
jgi:hypothetical protein